MDSNDIGKHPSCHTPTSLEGCKIVILIKLVKLQFHTQWYTACSVLGLWLVLERREAVLSLAASRSFSLRLNSLRRFKIS